jgi:hypothetical protein
VAAKPNSSILFTSVSHSVLVAGQSNEFFTKFSRRILLQSYLYEEFKQ